MMVVMVYDCVSDVCLSNEVDVRVSEGRLWRRRVSCLMENEGVNKDNLYRRERWVAEGSL